MKTSSRYLDEMADMYGLPDELYIMNRGVKWDGELRYDITEIPPLVINGQYNKTKGHIHSTGHNELYTVLDGEAIFLMQKDDDCYSVYAKKGDWVKIPGDYHHVTINPGKKTLFMANWISDKCKSDYTFMADHSGAAWYYTVDGWKHNKKHKNIKLRVELPLKQKPKDLSFLL